MAEKYGQIQEQTQQLKQGLMISRQQLLQASLVELPVMQLVDRINTEMNDNPALETSSPGDDDYELATSQGDELSTLNSQQIATRTTNRLLSVKSASRHSTRPSAA